MPTLMELGRAESKGRHLLQEIDLTQQYYDGLLCSFAYGPLKIISVILSQLFVP